MKPTNEDDYKELADQLVETVKNMDEFEKLELISVMLGKRANQIIDDIVFAVCVGLNYEPPNTHDITLFDLQYIVMDMLDELTPIYAELLRSGGNPNESN